MPDVKNMSDKLAHMHVTGAAHEGHSSSPKPTLKPMTRPAYGRAGRAITLDTNFFRMTLPSKLVVSQYAVCIFQRKHPSDMDPKQKRKRRARADRIPDEQYEMEKTWTDTAPSEPIFFNRAVFNMLLSRHGKEFGTRIAYDGRSIAYAPRARVNSQILGRKFTFRVGREGGNPTQLELDANKTIEVQVTIEHAKDLMFDDVLRSRPGTINPVEYLASLDNVLAHSPMKKYVQVGRSFYSPSNATLLSKSEHGTVSAWRGFYQSARMANVGLVLNVDESFTTFWNLGGRPLMDLVRQANNGKDPWQNQRAVADVGLQLKAVKVRAIHNGITYKVHGFSRESADRITFEDARGRRISISEYFAETYNRKLRYGNLPCVRTHPKRDTFLPIELLVVMENQRMMGLLTPDQTSYMVRRASTRPDDKRKAAIQVMRGLDLNKDMLCNDFGLRVDEKLVRVQARVLNPPSILYSEAGSNKRQAEVRVDRGQWRYSNKTHLYLPAKLRYWILIVEERSLRDHEVNKFVDEFVQAGRRVGVPIAAPVVQTGRRNGLHLDMHRIIKSSRKYEATQMVMFIKFGQDAETYNKIKYAGDIELGIPTQVLLSKNLRNPRGINMYCDNVLLKVNTKLGGQNSRVASFASSGLRHIPDVPFLNTPHIILGADVTHPMPGGRTPSVAALVGSRDREGIQYSASIRNQAGRQEVIDDIGEMFMEVYRKWYVNFGSTVHAQKVIMFRDGVSEGQFVEVMNKEVDAIRKACEKIDIKFRPKLTYIIVTKRHHTKLFPSRPDCDKNGNVVPGTVVDRDITSGEFYDFYLNSHAGIQGTNKPSKYTVLVDESNLDVDQLQAFVFRMAHGFSRCNRSVSMVNSAYYAHLLAFRGRAYFPEDLMSDATSTSSSDAVIPAPQLNPKLASRLFFV